MNEISPELTAQNHAQVEQIRENLMARVDILAKQADYDNKLTETSKIIFAEVIAFEADPKIAEFCLQNLNKNGLKDVKVVNKAFINFMEGKLVRAY